jgi:hypothetical protein
MLRSRPRRSALIRAGAAAVAAASVALLLGGCVGVPGATPTPTAAPSPSPEPTFASDEEALAAAEAAYEEFEAMSLQIASESGAYPERVEALVTPDYAAELHPEFAKYAELGIRAAGDVSLDTFSLVEHSQSTEGTEVAIYVCRDVSGVRVLDSTGSDVTPADRDDRTPLVASLLAADSNRTLLVDGVELWSGDDFC